MKQKSHVQITKALLRNFSHLYHVDGKPNGRRVLYLDLKDNQIKDEKINVLGTKPNYYSLEIERLLCRNVESQFGQEMQKACDFSRGIVKHVVIDQAVVKNFFLFSLLRSAYMLNAVNNERAELAKLLLPPISHEDILLHPEAAEGAYADYFANIFLNDSSVDLVIPKNCVYQVAYKSGNAIVFMPITPNVAFALIHKDDSGEFINENGLLVAHTSSDGLIMKFNENALEYEQKWSNDFIVARREDELIYLQKLVLQVKSTS